MPQPTEGAPKVPTAWQGSQRHGSVLSDQTCDQEENASVWKRANRRVRPSPNRCIGVMAEPPARDQTAATARRMAMGRSVSKRVNRAYARTLLVTKRSNRRIACVDVRHQTG